MNNITYEQITEFAMYLCDELYKYRGKKVFVVGKDGFIVLNLVYLDAVGLGIELTDNPEEADFYLHDIVYTGSLRKYYFDHYGVKPWLTLIDASYSDKRLILPWSRNKHDRSIKICEGSGGRR